MNADAGDVQTIIQAIAKKHGVVLGKDDPVLMLHTFMECFLGTLATFQEEERARLVSALEMEQQKWSVESKARAERILTAALQGAQKTATELCEQSAATLVSKFDAAMTVKLDELAQKQVAVYRLAVVNLACAGLLAVAGLFLWLRF